MSYIVIVGGQLHNKGAQAMVFTVVDNLKRKYPDKKVVLFASVYTERDEQTKENYNFEVIPWPLRAQMKFIGPISIKHLGLKEYIKFIIKGTGLSNAIIDRINHILNSTNLMIDVSGYALSSQRGVIASIRYLYNIMIAKRYNIPIVVFPQSFGPFNYDKKYNNIIIPLIKEYLNYPEVIYVREKDGINNLKPFNLTNVKYSMDSVLQGDREYNLTNIFKKSALNSQKVNIEVNQQSIAIVPNIKIMEHGQENKLYNIYYSIINQLVDSNYTVYLIKHSYEDLQICKNIKKKFINNNNVILIEDDLNCIQINELLSKFNFIIASRYHSIIHAYKNGVPAVVFGWAKKYEELLNYFNQEKYLFDVRDSLVQEAITNSLQKMSKNYLRESEHIKNKMNELFEIDLMENLLLKEDM